jgi:hypothetical protein
VPHLELELTEDARRLAPTGPGGTEQPLSRSHSSLVRWAASVAGATEPSLVLTADAVIVAASSSCAELIGLPDPAALPGTPLRDAVPQLVDFTESLGELDNSEAGKIPPLLAISSGRLARGLMRVVCCDGTVRTMDAVATPLWDGPALVGSLTFFSKI